MLKGLLGKKTVDQVVASFNQTVLDLEDIAEQNDEEALAKRLQISQLNIEVAHHEAEAARADRIKAKISELLA